MFMWVITVCIVIISWLASRSIRKNSKKSTTSHNNNSSAIPPNTVCLYQVGRGPLTPSLSPFPLKLETFLRMAKIPYVVIEDSQLCIDFCKTYHLGMDVNKGLTDQELGLATAFRAITEENMYWTMCYESFVRTPASLDLLLKDIFPWWKIVLFKKGVGWKVRRQLWGQGMGRHSDDEIWAIAQKDLKALSSFIGSKPYLLGDDPHEIDCTVFGMLAMVVWQMSTTRHERFVKDELPNLVEYCERMKDRFWPDWEQRCKGDNYENDEGKVYLFST